MKDTLKESSKFDIKKSINRARGKNKAIARWRIKISDAEVEWSNITERIALIRKGVPFESIEVISKQADLSVKQMLSILGIPQTTYNKKKRDNDTLNGRDSEVVLLLTELLDMGVIVFNHEEKIFQRWLRKPNPSLGGVKPESLFDSISGIQEIKNSLNRLEYGNMA